MGLGVYGFRGVWRPKRALHLTLSDPPRSASARSRASDAFFAAASPSVAMLAISVLWLSAKRVVPS
jgi:hypothetical protein